MLYHGSGRTCPEIIMSQGFNLAHANEKTLFGKAIYLASTADVAMNHAYVHNNGARTIIAVFCLPGVIKCSDRSLVQPKDADTRLEAWNDKIEPILLVYDPTRIYAAYTLTFH